MSIEFDGAARSGADRERFDMAPLPTLGTAASAAARAFLRSCFRNRSLVALGASAILGGGVFEQRAFAQPQDNFWLEGQWATRLPAAEMHSVAFTTNGQVVIGNHGVGILVFESTGNLVRTWAAAVHDLDVDVSGLIYAIVGGSVVAYDVSGATIRQWPLPFASVGIGCGTNGNVFVSDYNGSRIVAYDCEGSVLRQWGTRGSVPGQFGNVIHDVCVAPSGTVYVADTANNRIQFFTPEGVYRGTVDFPSPARIAVSPDEALVLASRTYSGGRCIGNFSPEGQVRCGLDGGIISIFRRGYSTTGHRPPSAVPVPRLVRAGQRPASALVDVTFKILDPDSPLVNVAAVAFLNGQSNLASLVRMTTF